MPTYFAIFTDLPAISDSTPEDAHILPSFAELDKFIKSAKHLKASPKVYIFPSSYCDLFRRRTAAGVPDVPPTIHYPSTEHPNFWAALWEPPRSDVPYTKVRFHYSGPDALCVYRPTKALGMDFETSRIHASIRAQWHLHDQMGGMSVAPPAPDPDSVSVNLNYLMIDTIPTMSQVEFGFLLQVLAPPDVPMGFHVAEWILTCPYCSEDVIGYSFDQVWNERFIRHIFECEC